MSGRWYRDVYCDAVWECESLKAQEKAVAETYARHAHDKDGNKSATADLAWITYERLMAKAGIGRRAGVSVAVAALVESGWLKPVQQVSRRATVYRLTIPVGGSSDGGTTEPEAGGSDGGTTVVPLSESGSSTFPSGSSDGGTQPLGPLKRSPLTSSYPEPSAPAIGAETDGKEGGDEESSKPDNPNRTIAEELLREHHDDLPRWRQRKLEDLITHALDAGWSPADIENELTSPTAGLNDVGAGLVARIQNLGTPPTNRGPFTQLCGNCRGAKEVWLETYQTMVGCPDCAGTGTVEPPALDDAPCPLHRGAKWHHCPACWGDVKAGHDPYIGDLSLRPAGWFEIYRKKDLAEERDRDRRRARGENVPYRDPVDPARYYGKL